MIGIGDLLIFMVVSLTTYYIVFYWKSQRVRKLAAKLPGLDGLSLLSSIVFVFTSKRKDYIKTFISYIKDEYPLTKFWFMNKLIIITKDADFIHKIFNSSKVYDKPSLFYQGFLVENGLLALSGDEHKRHRKILNKAFSSKMLKRLPEIFDEKSKKVLGLLEKRVDCGEFELIDYIGAYSFETFGKSNFNYEIDYYQSDILSALEIYMSLMFDTMPFFVIGLGRKFLNLMKVGKSLTEVEKKCDKYFTDVRKNHQQSTSDTKNTVIDLLLDPKNNFNEHEIKDNLLVTSLGAYETTTITMSTAVMMLGMHKDVQQKAVAEIEEIYSQESNPEFTNEFLQKFIYLEMFLKETMRLFPVASVVARETSEEVDINGYLIPKNTPILISIYSMHRDEKYWGSDADLFRPERFEEELKNPHAWAPFTGGSRICLGYRYAMTSMKIFFINFLRSYKVDCSTKLEELETEMTFTLTFLNGYHVSISRK